MAGTGEETTMKPFKPTHPTPPGRGEALRRTRSEPADSRPMKPAADAATPPATGPGDQTKGERPPQTRGRRLKAAFERTPQEPTEPDRPLDLPDQEPPRAQRRRGAGREDGEQYVRLRVRVRGDQLSVVDSHLVDGPLAQVTTFPGSNAYEVVSGDRLLHAGALPDLGIQRSFVNPNGPATQRGHHITERETFEFSARVPAHELTAETIADIRVVLHRVTEEVRADRLDSEPIGRRFARELRPVAEVVGLPESALPAAIEARGGRTPSI
jgi:hypothetical protein